MSQKFAKKRRSYRPSTMESRRKTELDAVFKAIWDAGYRPELAYYVINNGQDKACKVVGSARGQTPFFLSYKDAKEFRDGLYPKDPWWKKHTAIRFGILVMDGPNAKDE